MDQGDTPSTSAAILPDGQCVPLVCAFEVQLVA
jgi:hypothetical protein